MGDIGYQDGIEAFEQWFRKLSTYIDGYNNWIDEVKAWNALPDDLRENVDIPLPPKMPKIPLEGANFNPNDMSTWPWPLKFFDNTMRKLKDDHDAAPNEPDPPNGGGEPPVPTKRLAPMTHYAAEGADARFCVHSPGVTQIGPDDYRDEGNFVYSENGLCKSGGRSGQKVNILKGANSMDGMEPCAGYTKDGRTFPPWPPESYEV